MKEKGVCKVCGWESCVCIPNKPKWLGRQDYEFIKEVCGDYSGDMIGLIKEYKER